MVGNTSCCPGGKCVGIIYIRASLAEGKLISLFQAISSSAATERSSARKPTNTGVYNTRANRVQLETGILKRQHGQPIH